MVMTLYKTSDVDNHAADKDDYDGNDNDIGIGKMK